MSVKPWKRSQVIGTRDHLIETAAQLFGKQGFGETSLVQIVSEAGLTRGAVYHHFEDKADLFRAVLDRVLRDLVYSVEKRAIKRGAARGEDPVETLLLLAEALASPPTQRIVSIDGPSVLTHGEWSAALDERLLAPIRRVLETAARASGIAPDQVRPLARLLGGAVREVAFEKRQNAPTGRDCEAALRVLIERLLHNASPGSG